MEKEKGPRITFKDIIMTAVLFLMILGASGGIVFYLCAALYKFGVIRWLP